MSPLYANLLVPPESLRFPRGTEWCAKIQSVITRPPFSSRLLYGSANTSSRFSWLDRTGKLVGGVGEPGEYGAFRLSADGRRAAIARDAPDGADLWLVEVQRGVFSRFTFHPGTNAYPVWSPDGRTILFGSTGAQTGSQNLFSKQSSGAGDEQRLAQSPNVQDPTDWSGDGRWALYHEVA